MDKFKALLVGAGGMGRAWGQNLHDCDEVEIAGWVDVRSGVGAAALGRARPRSAERVSTLGRISPPPWPRRGLISWSMSQCPRRIMT